MNQTISDLVDELKEKAEQYLAKYEISDFTYFEFTHLQINIQININDVEASVDYKDIELKWYASAKSDKFEEDIKKIKQVINSYFSNKVYVLEKNHLIFGKNLTEPLLIVRADESYIELGSGKKIAIAEPQKLLPLIQ